MHSGLRGMLGGAWVLMALAAAAPAAGQVLQGHVLDDESGQPIPGAQVEMLHGGRRPVGRALSDASGRFSIQASRQGSFQLRAGRLGYATATTPEVGVATGDTVEVVLRLRTGSVLLAPLEVVTRPRRVSNSPLLSYAFERMERGLGGRFITASDIRLRNPTRLTDMLNTQGVVVSGTNVYMSRTRCPPAVMIDGFLASRSEGSRSDAIQYNAINLTDPGSVEMIEVYNGLAGIPPEWVNIGKCGVIAIWTRRGPDPAAR